MCVLFGLYNLVKGPTRFKSKHGSLLDVILVNKSSNFYNTLNVVNSVSDFHNMVATMMRFHVPYKHDKYIQYRSFKNYTKINYTSSIENSQITKCKNVENTNHAWKLFSDCLKEVIEDHAPLKTKKFRPDQPPFMNTRIRIQIWKRKRMYKKFLKNKSTNTWKDYKKQRNYCVKLRRSSMKNYLKTKCEKNDTNFWNTVKPFLSKSNKSFENIILSENSRIINNQKEISEIMNDYYNNVAKDIGQNQNIDITEHPSIIENKQHSESNNFQFHHTTREDVLKILKKLNPKKATGCDQIPAKLLKHASFQIAPVISNIINKALDKAPFQIY